MTTIISGTAKWLQHRRRIIHLIFFSGLSGFLLSLSYPKSGLSFLAWIALVPFLSSLKSGHAREPYVSALSFGVVHGLTLLYWVVHTLNIYGYLPMVLCIPILLLLVLYLSCYPLLFAWLIVKIVKKPMYLMAAAPSMWVLLEYLKSWALTGFPWELLGYSQHNVIQMIQIADITGVYGISFLIVLVNTAVFTVFLYMAKKDWCGESVTGKTAFVHGILATACVVLVAAYGFFRIQATDYASAAADTATVSVVQGNIDQSVKWNSSYQVKTLMTYGKLSKLAAGKDKPDFIVWPETAAPFYYENDRLLTALLKQTLTECDTEFLIGFPSYEKDGGRYRFYNSAYAMAPDGQVGGKYSKVHLVPFGEYVPLQDFLPFIDKLTAQSGDFYAGQKGDTLVFSPGKIGVQICFEVIFPNLTRAMVQNGARLIANITNDAWFGTTSAPYQHFSMVKFRAVENKRAIARAANTGISGFIDPCGRVLAATGLYEEAYLTRKLPLPGHMTFYTRFGDVFVLFCAALMIPALVSFFKRHGAK